MKKLFLFLALFFWLGTTFAQNVSLKVEVTELHRSNNLTDGGISKPDPIWFVTGFINGSTTGSFRGSYSNMPGLVWDLTAANACNNPPCIGTPINLSSTSATTFTLGLRAWDDDGCGATYEFNTNCTFNDDDDFCQNNNIVVSNFRQSAPCTWHTAISPYCNGNFRFKYRYYWSWAEAPAITVQPTPNTVSCLGDAVTTLSVTAPNDANGNVRARHYQWQVSENTACAGASGWMDIPGATASSYQVPQISGTRLYRCKISANCSADFNSNTAYSNCSRVTYHPMDGATSNAPANFPYRAGDAAPDIQTGICGTTVLPGSKHQLGTLQAPAVNAVANITGYSWTTTGGTFSNNTASATEWTAPTTPGTYTINLTYQDNCSAANRVVACRVNVGSPSCDLVYVDAATGADATSNGGPSNPFKTIAYALANRGSRTHIKVTNGNYTETNTLELASNITIEGGYSITGGIWSKSSNSTTSIECRGTGSANVGGVNVGHVLGFNSDGDNNWKLIDLSIKTVNASGQASNRGKSNYAIRINNSTGYELIRCNITSGNASSGADGFGKGANGSNGAYGNRGQNGDEDGAPGNGGGAVTGPGTGVRKGGNGGAGGKGGNEGRNAGRTGGLGSNGGGGAARDASAGSGGNGGNPGRAGSSASNSVSTSEAANGNNGTGYSAGNRPNNFGYNIFFVPGAKAADGADGGGGGGGAGGGGGGGQGGWWVNDGGGNGAGSGGAGGEGGQGGAGAYGGGSSFGIYTNGSTGTITDCTILSGNAGNGGNGQNGGSGGNGGNGGYGASRATNEIGRGGNGSKGGRGGNGGRGQDGANGVSHQVYTVGTGASTPSVAIPNTPVVTVKYNNGKLCPNSVIELTKSAGTWKLATDFKFIDNQADGNSSYANTDATIQVYTENTTGLDGDAALTAVNFPSYLQISKDARTRPTITASATEICKGGTVNLNASAWGTEASFQWEVYSTTTATGTPVFSYTTDQATAGPFTTAGTYLVKYQVREQCCGWSRPSYTTITVSNDIANYELASSNMVSCTDAIAALDGNTPTGGTGTYTYEWQQSTDNATFAAIAGATSEDYTVPANTYTASTRYFRRKVTSGGCEQMSASIKVDFKTKTADPVQLVATPNGACKGPVDVKFSVQDGAGNLVALGTDATWTLYYNSIASGKEQRINITTNPFTQSITTGGTYYVRAEGGCNTTAAVSTKIGFGGAENIALTADSDLGVATKCDDGSWTYYQDEEDATKYIFAIEWGSLNAAAKAAATLDLNVQAQPFTKTDNVNKEGTWAMRRHWNVNLNGASINPAQPVNVRFYYDQADVDQIEAMKNTFISNSGGAAADEGWAWFKTQTGKFDGTQMTAAEITGVVSLLPASTTKPTATGKENGVNYVQFNGLTSFSGGTLVTGAGANLNPLPVELTTFKAYAKDKVNILEWNTASETNNSHFEVERANNGTHEFKTIGKVAGNGTTTEPTSYSFTDEQPLLSGYYRLKQVDFDGEYEYSEIVHVLRKEAGFEFTNVYPNPTTKELNIKFVSTKNMDLSLSIFDMLGRKVYTKTVAAQNGVQIQSVNMEDFPAGVYTVVLENDLDKKYMKVTKK